ncbi:MAG: IS982 family transposase, partial [Prevotellaceae bacterium]|nr:IS982 family transposase [Prevotellaceae bacterium]
FAGVFDRLLRRYRATSPNINDLLKNKADIVHSRHRSIHNFIMNIRAALTAYSFFENKPQALSVHVEHSAQLTLF